MINIDIERARGIATRLGLGPGSKNRSKCIVIGGSPSMKGTALGEYVDQFDGDVIRVNAPANPDYAGDCGSRTDVLFRSEWLDKNIYKSDAGRKIIINKHDTLALSEDFNLEGGMYLTTGTLCIILALSVYDTVETLGFGDDGTEGTDLFVTLHPVPYRDAKKKGSRCPHDIDFEHAALAQLRKGQFEGRLVQLEGSALSKRGRSRRMSCWDRFDRKTLVTFTGYRYSRVPGLINELRRIGMDGVEVQWQFPDPFATVLMNNLKCVKQMSRGGYFNCTMGHYRAIQTAYNLGCSEALFMEDDIRFLKDTSEISDFVNSIPGDYDLATFDPTYRSWPVDQIKDFISWRDCRKVNEHWSEFDALWSCGCYALSRKGMEKMIANYNAAVDTKGQGILRVCDHYLDRSAFGRNAKLYFSRKNVCMQTRMGPANSCMDNIEGRYVKMGLNFSDYETTNLPPQTAVDTVSRQLPPKAAADAVGDKRDGTEPVDAVFVVGTESVDNNEELRYALRNLEKHCKFVRDVYICGICPSWVDRTKVKHLSWPDRYDPKDSNIIDKLRHACSQTGIAKKILFCSDDQFQTRECTWDDFEPRWIRKYEPGDKWYANMKRLWHTRLRKTLEREVQRRRAIGMSGKNVFYYQPHMWMQIDRDRFLDYARWSDYEHRDDTIIASGYFNFANAHGKEDSDHVFLKAEDKDIPTATHVAYHDGSYRAALPMLKRLFPEPSRFEIASRRSAASNDASSAKPVMRLPSGDPSPATSSEMSRFLEVMSKIRGNPIWHGLLSEVSRAEELRLFGVRGWRTVWEDIVSRWSAETDEGRNAVPVTSQRSDEASEVVSAYMTNPEVMRTVSYGPQTDAGNAAVDKVRASLRGRGK